MTIVTEQILFAGTVQGVGFRWTAERLARGIPVTGFVRNMADGRVEIVANGELEDVSELIRGLKVHFGAGISRVERNPGPASEEFSAFTIRR